MAQPNLDLEIDFNSTYKSSSDKLDFHLCYLNARHNFMNRITALDRIELLHLLKTAL